MDLKLGARRIRELAESRGISVNKMLVSELRLSKSIVDHMIEGSVPSADKMQAIAKFLDTSVAYILGDVDDPSPAIKPATPEEQPVGDEDIEVARRITNLDPEKKARILGYLDSLENQDI